MYRVHSGGVFLWGSPVLYLYSRHAVYQMKPWGKKVKPSVKTQTEGDHLQWATWFYSRRFDKQHTRMKRRINGSLLVPWRQFPETDTTFHMQRGSVTLNDYAKARRRTEHAESPLWPAESGQPRDLWTVMGAQELMSNRCKQQLLRWVCSS